MLGVFAAELTRRDRADEFIAPIIAISSALNIGIAINNQYREDWKRYAEVTLAPMPKLR
jgi:hypothetical protein